MLCERGWSAGLWPQGLGASEQNRWSVACWAKMAAAVACMQQGRGRGGEAAKTRLHAVDGDRLAGA